MKPNRFTEEQIIAILREQEAGAATADVCRKRGISSATFYKWQLTPTRRKAEVVAHMRNVFQVSERRACAVLGVDCTSARYRCDRRDDAAVRARMRELAAIRRRFGYRRLLVLMRHEGLLMNHKKFRRLYR